MNEPSEALIIVDIQNDFLPGGALATTDGDAVIPVANHLMDRFGLVIATQDWHPADHKSFAVHHRGKNPGNVIDLNGLTQILWPVHCVQDSEGAAFATALDSQKINEVFQKGTNPEIDSYSGFYDNGHRQSTGLGTFLEERGVRRVFILGLATDYCVKFTALDARRLGLETIIVKDGCRGVNLADGDVARALAEVKDAGARIIDSRSILGQ